MLNGMPAPTANPNVLVGGADWDDAGVIRVSPELALVHTVDFFTPIVDDPRDFGAVAAVNALSDVYAMGGTPVSALAIVCFPHRTLPIEVLAETMQGAAEVLAEAGVSLLGGHSVKDPEFKFGFAVTGHVHPDRIVRNRGAEPGDVLMLTKPIGTGILATAVKRDLLDPETVAVLVRTLRTLNRAASQAMLAAGAHAAFPRPGGSPHRRAPARRRARARMDRRLSRASRAVPGARAGRARGAHPSIAPQRAGPTRAA